MTAFRLFGKSAANEAADRIIAAVSQAARTPDLFGEGGVPDTLTGRFEVMTAYAAVALERLKAAPEAERVAQAFTDRLFRFFDAGLREAGVGDLSVAKRMKALAGAFYGRVGAYGPAFDDAAALAAALARNIWNAPEAPLAPVLAARLRAVRDRLAKTPLPAVEDAKLWAPGG